MNTRTLLIIICFGIINITNLFAQTRENDKKEETIEIKTSAICGMCKATIEKALKKKEGVVKSKLDVKTKIVTVTYDPAKTNPDEIRKAVTMSGYDADDMPADTNAYNKLHDCCKK